MGQNIRNSTLFLLSLKLSAGDLCLKNANDSTSFAAEKLDLKKFEKKMFYLDFSSRRFFSF